VSCILNDIKSLWSDSFPEYPEQNLEKIIDTASADNRNICCCFYLYRYLHRVPTPLATLTGDYCFARFSKYLSELDSVPVTDSFAEYLRKDTALSASFDHYLDFVRKLPAVNGHGT